MVLLRQPLLHGGEQLGLDNGRMLARVRLAAIDHLAEVAAVAQEIGARSAGERDAAAHPPIGQFSAPGQDAAPVQLRQ